MMILFLLHVAFLLINNWLLLKVVFLRHQRYTVIQYIFHIFCAGYIKLRRDMKAKLA